MSLSPTPSLLLVQGRWTATEDAALLEAVNKYGTCWSEVATDLPGRLGTQCAQRYKYAVDPFIRKDATYLRDLATADRESFQVMIRGRRRKMNNYGKLSKGWEANGVRFRAPSWVDLVRGFHCDMVAGP